MILFIILALGEVDIKAYPKPVMLIKTDSSFKNNEHNPPSMAGLAEIKLSFFGFILKINLKSFNR